MSIKFGKKRNEKPSKKIESREAKEFTEMSSWIQRIEQNVESLEKRLDAVERRLSGEPFEGTKFIKFSDEKVNESAKMYKELKGEIEKLKREMQHRKEPVSRNETVVISLRKGERKIDYEKELMDLKRRLEKVEKRKATVKLGKIEVPIEITGLVGGILILVIAILLFGGYKQLVISPPFVTLIGVILLMAVALKTYMINISRK